MDTSTDRPVTHRDFRPSFSTFAKLVLPCIIGGGLVVYFNGISALPIFAIVTAAYVALCVTGLPFVRVTDQEFAIRYLMPLRPKRTIAWTDIDRYVSTPVIRGASKPFIMQLHQRSGKTISIIAPTIRDPIELDQAIRDRLPTNALTAEQSSTNTR